MNKILVVGAESNVLQLLKTKMPDWEFVTETSDKYAVLIINLDDKSISLSDVENQLIPEIEMSFEYFSDLFHLNEHNLSTGDTQNILIHEVHPPLYVPKVQVKFKPSDRYYHNRTKPYGKKNRQRF